MWGKVDTPNLSEDLIPEAYGWRKGTDSCSPVWFYGPLLPENLRYSSEDVSADLNPDDSYDHEDLEDIQEAGWSESSAEEDEN